MQISRFCFTGFLFAALSLENYAFIASDRLYLASYLKSLEIGAGSTLLLLPGLCAGSRSICSTAAAVRTNLSSRERARQLTSDLIASRIFCSTGDSARNEAVAAIAAKIDKRKIDMMLLT